MALITCPECGHSISDKAAACPHCGFPLQPSLANMNCETASKVKRKRRKQRRCFTELKNKKRIAVLISIFAVLSVVAIAVSAFVIYDNRPKDEAYLYEWLTEHGTLVNGSVLQYTDTDSDGNKFTLIYDPSRAKQARWYINYENSNNSQFSRSIRKLSLFATGTSADAYIRVDQIGGQEPDTTEMIFWHTPANFMRNSPVVLGDVSEYTSTTWWGVTRNLCENYAQTDLCIILDWLQNSFCQEANMKMTDFGYDAYK